MTDSNPPAQTAVDCVWCKGTGKDNAVDCAACDGQGKVLVPQPPKKCERCRGTGVEMDRIAYRSPRCIDCGGSGWADSTKL